MRRLILLFLVLIVYGSLYPFRGWEAPEAPMLSFLFSASARIEKADLVQNLLAYMPFGLFVVAAAMRSMRLGPALGLAVVAGGALSLTMECIQQFLPSRDASRVDLMLNIAGSFGGGMLASFLRGDILSNARLHTVREEWIRAGTLPNLGLAALALWVLSQTSPLVPTFDMGQLRSGLGQLYRTLRAPEQLVILQATTYACYIGGLGLLARSLVHESKPSLRPFMALVGGVLLLKIIVEGRQLSLEALVGAAAAFGFLAIARRMTQPLAVGVAGSLLLGAGFIISELAPGPNRPTVAFNWIPLVGQMNSLSGLQNILEIVWPPFAIACFARGLTPPYRRMEMAVFGSVTVLVAVFTLEWAQQSLPGRYGDITQVVLGVLGWLLPWMFKGADYARPEH